MNVQKRIDQIEYKLLLREAKISELEAEIDALKKVRGKWKKVLSKGV